MKKPTLISLISLGMGMGHIFAQQGTPWMVDVDKQLGIPPKMVIGNQTNPVFERQQARHRTEAIVKEALEDYEREKKGLPPAGNYPRPSAQPPQVSQPAYSQEDLDYARYHKLAESMYPDAFVPGTAAWDRLYKLDQAMMKTRPEVFRQVDKPVVLVRMMIEEDQEKEYQKFKGTITSVAQAKQIVFETYPESTIPGSKMYVAVTGLYNHYQKTQPEFFTKPSWPLTLADEVAMTQAKQAVRAGGR